MQVKYIDISAFQGIKTSVSNLSRQTANETKRKDDPGIVD